MVTKIQLCKRKSSVRRRHLVIVIKYKTKVLKREREELRPASSFLLSIKEPIKKLANRASLIN